MCNLFPTGITEDLSIIDTWALRQGHALQRLVTWIFGGAWIYGPNCLHGQMSH